MRATVLVCAHNEEKYIKGCLRSILLQNARAEQVTVVADRCTDSTIAITKQELANTRSTLIIKDRASWKNSISENLELGLESAVGDALVIVDADMVLPATFLETLLAQLDGFAVVSALVRTDPRAGALNKLVAAWELTYRFSPLGDQPRGGARACSIRAIQAVGGFRDVYAWESELDTRLRRAGYRTKLDRTITALHRRRMTLQGSVRYQMRAGKARRELGISPFRTLLHSIVRLRPFVIVGYLQAVPPRAQ